MNKFWKYFTISKEERPAWCIDAKWIFGILFVVIFSSTMALYNVMQLTSRERAVEIITGVIEKSITKMEGNIQELITDYKNSLVEKQDSLPEAQTESDKPIVKILKNFFPDSVILNSSPEQLKNQLLQDIAVPVYESGSGVLFTLLRGVDYATYIDQGLQSFKIYSDETHAQLVTWFTVSLIVSLVMLFGLVYFSRRLGKLFNPGLVLLLASMPGYFSYGIAHQFVGNVLPTIATEGANLFVNVFVVAIVETLDKQVSEITIFHTVFFYIGLGLMIAAIGVKIYFVIKKRQAQKKPVTPPAPWPKKS